MISFFLCLLLLIGGYFVYGKIVENTFAPDDRETPAVKINDGVDYVVMPQWKLFFSAAFKHCRPGTDFLVPCEGARVGTDRIFYGSHLVRFLQAVSMITFQVCFLKEIMVHQFQRFVVFTLEMQ
mgnify:CR=1 FL=1